MSISAFNGTNTCPSMCCQVDALDAYIQHAFTRIVYPHGTVAPGLIAHDLLISSIVSWASSSSMSVVVTHEPCSRLWPACHHRIRASREGFHQRFTPLRLSGRLLEVLVSACRYRRLGPSNAGAARLDVIHDRGDFFSKNLLPLLDFGFWSIRALLVAEAKLGIASVGKLGDGLGMAFMLRRGS